jgi:hypothetical protein
MSDVSYAGPLNQWLAQAPPQPPPRVVGKPLAERLAQYLGNGDQTQDAAEAAAQRVRAPYAKANARESGLPDVGKILGNKLVNTLMAGPNLMGQVAEGSVDPNSEEGIRRATDVASSTLGYGMLGARPGAAGMAGGRLGQPANMNIPKGTPANANLNTSAADLLANDVIPPPLNAYERTWQNYTKHMTPEEMMQSGPIWSGAKVLAEQEGIKEHEAFANLVNDYYGRKGIKQFMTPEAARRYMAKERGIGAVPAEKGN